MPNPKSVQYNITQIQNKAYSYKTYHTVYLIMR